MQIFKNRFTYHIFVRFLLFQTQTQKHLIPLACNICKKHTQNTEIRYFISGVEAAIQIIHVQNQMTETQKAPINVLFVVVLLIARHLE